MLKDAETVGDDLMKKAVAYQSDALGYGELTRAALDHVYDDELNELDRLRDTSPHQKFAEGNAFGGVS